MDINNQIMNFCSDIISESNLFTKKLYHGSLIKSNILEPTAIDIGNKFQNPGWSLFCWDKKDYAIGWVIMQCIRKISDDFKHNNKDNKDLKVLWYLPHNKPCLTISGVNKVKDYIKTHTLEGYVYSISCPMHKVGIGNDIALPEYTIRQKIIIPDKIDTIKLNNNIIDKYVSILQEEEIQSYKDDIMNQNYDKYKRFYSIFMIKNHNEKMKMKRNIQDALVNGDINVGDDISMYK